MKKLILVLVLITWGCVSPLKMVKSPYGKIYKFQKKHIKEVRQVESAKRPIKIP